MAKGRQSATAPGSSDDAAASVRTVVEFVSSQPNVDGHARLAETNTEIADGSDVVAKLPLMAAWQRRGEPDGSAPGEGFVGAPRSRVEAIDAPACERADGRHGVRDAAILSTAAGPRSSEGSKVTVADIKLWAAAQHQPFTIREATEAVGGSLVTTYKAFDELISEGKLADIGPDPDRRLPGRAPARFVTL